MSDNSDRYFRVTESMNLWWDGGDRIHYTTAEAHKHSAFTDANGDAPGLHLIWSRNPRSTDYNPRYWNRGVRALRAAGCRHPDEIPERSRRLRDRFFGPLNLRPPYDDDGDA